MTPSLPLPQDEPDFPPDVDGVVPPPLPPMTAAEAAAHYAAEAGDVGEAETTTRPRDAVSASRRAAVFVVPPLPELPPPEVSVFAPESVRTLTPGVAREIPLHSVEAASRAVEPETLPEPEREAVNESEPEPEMPESVAAPVTDPETVPAPVAEPGAEAEQTAAAQEPEPRAVVADPLEALPVIEHAPDVSALRLRGLTKSFGQTRAVDGIDLDIPAGTFYGIVGPNGAGKTTTLSMIAGLLRPDRGTIEINGVDLGRDPRRAKRMMGILPDRLRTFDRLTGRQLLYYYGALRGLRGAVVESRTADLARAFDLTEALGRPVSDYSAGMTKKVMLAGAMIHSPRLLVLDEPFESMDPVSSAVIVDILRAYVSHGGTVVLSSHGMEFVERVCSGVAVIVAGQMLAEGPVDRVRGELTLEQRFVELAGGLSDVEGLEWLHTFSD